MKRLTALLLTLALGNALVAVPGVRELVPPQAAFASPAKLASARQAYAVGDVPGAARVLQGLIGGGSLRGAQLEDARELYGICQFLLGNKEKAEHAFTMVLKANPNARLNPKDLIDPTSGEFFEQVRNKVAPRARAASGDRPKGQGSGEQSLSAKAPPRAGFTGIFVKTNASNATVFANGIFIGTSGQDIALDAGEHKLTISAQDYEDVTRAFNIKKNERLTLTVNLVKSGERDRFLAAKKAKAKAAENKRREADRKKKVAKEKIDYTSDLPAGARPSKASQSLADEFFRDQQGGMPQQPPPQPAYAQDPYGQPVPQQPAYVAPRPPPPQPQYNPGYAAAPYPAQPGYPPAAPVGRKKSLFLAIMPFGVGQFQNGATGLGIAVAAGQLGSLYAFYHFSGQATAYMNSEPVICEEQGQAQKDKAEACTPDADVKAFVAQQNMYGYGGIAAFLLIWGAGATEAVLNIDGPGPRAPAAPPPPAYYGDKGTSGEQQNGNETETEQAISSRVPVVLRIRPLIDPVRSRMGVGLRLDF